MALGSVSDNDFKTFVRRVNDAAKAKTMLADVQREMVKVGNFVMAGAKSRTPVDTGTLRRNWQKTGVSFNTSSVSITISNNTEYAPFIENGHRTRGGKGWVNGKFILKDSVDELNIKFESIWEPVITKHLEELFND